MGVHSKLFKLVKVQTLTNITVQCNHNIHVISSLHLLATDVQGVRKVICERKFQIYAYTNMDA